MVSGTVEGVFRYPRERGVLERELADCRRRCTINSKNPPRREYGVVEVDVVVVVLLHTFRMLMATSTRLENSSGANVV